MVELAYPISAGLIRLLAPIEAYDKPEDAKFVDLLRVLDSRCERNELYCRLAT